MALVHQTNLRMHYVPTPEEPEVLVIGSGSSTVGVARVRCTAGGVGHFSPVPEDAFLVSHHLSNFRSDVWVDGRLVEKPANVAGLTSIHDYRRKIDCDMHTAFDTLTFHLPWTALESACPDALGGRLEDLSITPSSPVDDPTVRALSLAILPTLDCPERISLLYVDHLCSALATHVVTAYGRVNTARSGGTLAPWQERRVKELIAANLDGEIRLADLAAECRLSVGHFVRAFRRTANTTPYQWLLHRRIDHAKTLMRDGSQTLADVALACGFADQSHFTRTFSRLVGISPRSWRRRAVGVDAVPPAGASRGAPAERPCA
ncbi:transcriptional regulator [Azospirillum sp. TSH100]|uniref:helix-turn-helix transcriptional regulator n=1 Tax=Azospirillum sp. TSH100 TaxID=652764 RepID=UPI000D6142F4|nr:AraC family transcriptional regulator [Azospirillum sp. TSH100]PWC84638.1 transcriptional regulator [Azospirillum sp. TSH100]QCG91013.1 helix-turn-helix transcriptional regulator [Azospirillum sp. TSH100]